jgi:transposase
LRPWRATPASGKAKRFIRGGRAALRHALSMPALVAMPFNADLKAVYDRLTESGKPAEVAIVAVMRKMLILANAPLKKGARWEPKPA